MKSRFECIPCSLRQAMLNANQVTDDVRVTQQCMNAAMEYLKGVDLAMSPAEIASWCARIACEIVGNPDPFAEEKARYNRVALDLLPYLNSLIDSSSDRLGQATLLAAAGNIIDLGIFTSIDVRQTVDSVVARGLAIDDSAEFRQKLGDHISVLYIGDNAGEIVFDTLLVKELLHLGVTVTFAVRSAPISNDVTVRDAIDVGMDKLACIVETGCWEMGVPTARCSDGFWDLYDSCDIVISKGHANFETLERPHTGLFFLLTAKCQMVADELGVRVGDTVFCRR